jgi:hypothetical protein
MAQGTKRGRWDDLFDLRDEFMRERALTGAEFLSGRTLAMVGARRTFIRAVRRLGYSLPQIGAAVNRHHTTVLHALRLRPR